MPEGKIWRPFICCKINEHVQSNKHLYLKFPLKESSLPFVKEYILPWQKRQLKPFYACLKKLLRKASFGNSDWLCAHFQTKTTLVPWRESGSIYWLGIEYLSTHNLFECKFLIQNTMSFDMSRFQGSFHDSFWHNILAINERKSIILGTWSESCVILKGLIGGIQLKKT